MSKMTPKRRRTRKLALILCGGGIKGFLYEVGALAALDDLFEEGRTTNDFDIYIGISAGAAVSALVRSIAVEYGRYGIRANAILPGWIETDMTAGIMTDERFQRSQLGRTSLKRWGRPDDFAGIAVYLASDASRFHTGDTIVIDGGYLVD